MQAGRHSRLTLIQTRDYFHFYENLTNVATRLHEKLPSV